MVFGSELAKTFSLEGKVVVITGAGSGLSQEAARLFALAGATLVLADVEVGLAETKALAGSERTFLHRVDVARRDEVEALADAAESQAGSLDVWINGAGVSYLHKLLEADPEKAQRTIAVNMMGPYWGCAAAGRVMARRGGGTIVNLSSGGGSKPLPGIGIYGMTKAAVNSLTWTAAAELGPHGIRVNAVAPGWIETPMSRDLFRDETGAISADLQEKVRANMAAQSPLGVLGAPCDVGYALLYLASEASRFVTGQILAVNGGESM